MTQQDHGTDTRRRKEKADEDRYFAEPDRKLIEQRQRQRQPAPAVRPDETAADVPAEPAPLIGLTVGGVVYRVLWRKSRWSAELFSRTRRPD